MFLLSFTTQILCLAFCFFLKYQVSLHRDSQSASLQHVKIEPVITESNSKLKANPEDLKDIF